MQTTLLGLAIALILALLTALVGPYFVNWNDHRAFFEAEASRLVGLDVQVAGAIDVGILPFPSVTLRGIEIGPARETSRLRARSLGIELALGPLMRGEVRAAEIRLVGPEFTIGLNSLGHVDWPAMTLATGTLSVDRLSIEDGRAVLVDAVSKSRLVLDKLLFTGELKSLIGPVRGEGAFAAAGGLYGYRLTAGRLNDEGLRIRLVVDNAERPLSIEAEGLLAAERGTPRFEGNLTFSRPAGSVLASGKAIVNEPWRTTSKVRATSASALFEQVEFQYGPEERAVKLGGAAEFKFGTRPRLQGALSARQVDLDRLIATSSVPRRLPLSAIQTFTEMFGGALRAPLPISLALSVDAVTIGGAVLQSVGTDLRSDGEGWQFDKLDFRAPGFTQVSASGRLGPAAKEPGKGFEFAGAVSVDANDPKTLVAWLTGQAAATAHIKPWQLRGEVTLAADRIAVERLKTDFDRGSIEGRVAYVWPAGDRPARLDANLRAGELDLDAVLAFSDAAFAGAGLQWPREVALALEVGRGRLAGFEARQIMARLKFDAGGIAVERISVADFGNAKIEASGRIATTSSPGGNITVDLDARELRGVIALAEKFAPALADPLKHAAARQKTATLRANLSLENTGAGRAVGRINLNGRVGAVRVSLTTEATGKPEAFAVADFGGLITTDIRLEGQLDADESQVLLGFIGLDRLTADRRPGRLSISANGPLNRELRVDGKLSAGPVEAAGRGTLRAAAGAEPARLEFSQVSGTVGGAKAQGRIAFVFADPVRVDGAVETESLDASALIAASVGLPASRGRAGASVWGIEPFVPKTSDLTGRIEIKAQQAAISSTLNAQQVRGVMRFGPSEVVFEDVVGDLAKGKLEGRLAFVSNPGGLTASGRIALNGADAATLAGSAIAGKVALQAEVEGAGLSPAAFVGSLAGKGTVTLTDARIASLNPRVFDAVIRAVDLGIPTDTNRIRDFVTTALDTGQLPVTRAEAAVTINVGQARFRNVTVGASGADLGLVASINLTDETLDATLMLSGMQTVGAGIRPTLSIALKGPLAAPKRTLDASALASWLALRSVEQQSKRLDAMEQIQRESAPPASVPAVTVDPTSTTQGVVPAEQAPPLPPAVTILPAPRPLSAPRNPPRADAAPRPARNPAPASAPPPSPPQSSAPPQPGWPLDLFGAQN